MKDILLTILRDKTSTQLQYREAAEKLAYILAAEVSEFQSKKNVKIATPLAEMQGVKLAHSPLLVPVLRSGLALLNPFMKFYPDAQVGFIGLRRDETTCIPHLYYHHLPKIASDQTVLLLEPMLATGGSIFKALKLLCENGASKQKILVVSVVGSLEGIKFLTKEMPEVHLHVACIDEKLNAQNFIVPGLGDFGDRYFGTATPH